MSLFLLASAVAALFTPPVCPAPSGASATVLVPETPALDIASGPLASGDVLAVYVGAECVGSSVWTGGAVAISVWADDPFTPHPDGFAEGDTFQLRAWSASAGSMVAAQVAYELGFGPDDGLTTDGLYVVAPAGAPTSAATWISELDTEPGAAFVEIRADAPGAAMPAVSLVAVDADGSAYGTLDLEGLEADAAGTVVVRPAGSGPGVTMLGVASFETEVGAFALYPTAMSPAVGQSVAGFTPLDALVARSPESGHPTGLLAALGRTVAFVDEPGSSLARPGGASLGTASLAYPAAPTPGAQNAASVLLPLPTAPGLRLTSLPVLSGLGEPLTVDDLGLVGPVAGVPGSSAPDADPTIWTDVDGGGVFAPAPSVDFALAPGAGFLWDWSIPEAAARRGSLSSRAAGPAQKTTSSVALDGLPLDDMSTGGPFLRALNGATENGHVLVGNPYAYPLRLSGLSVQGDASIQSALAVWDPLGQTYLNLFTRPEAPELAGVLPVWGGALAELHGAGQSLVATTTSRHVAPGADAGGEAPEGIAFAITGTLDGGLVVEDRAAHIVFLDGAVPTWDAHDATKLMPPTEAHALLAPVGVREGEARRQRVLSLPSDAAGVSSLAFAATAAGTFTIHWDVTVDRQGLALRDKLLDAEVLLATTAEYVFSTDAPTDWTERFELVPASTKSESAPDPDAVSVGVPFPNPTAHGSTLRLQAGQAQRVGVEVVDALGRHVARHAVALEAGVPADVALDARSFAPGLYIAVVRGETFSETRRLTVAR